jgi:hypothetical protein
MMTQIKGEGETKMPCKRSAEESAEKIKTDATVSQAAPEKKRKAALKAGTKYTCSDCGLVVVIEQACSCDGPCDLNCCGKPLKAVK